MLYNNSFSLGTNDLVNIGVTALAGPEAGLALGAARRSGILEKIKNA